MNAERAASPQDQVLAMWPEAVCRRSQWIKPWVVSTQTEHLGFGDTEAEAWQNAAKRIEP